MHALLRPAPRRARAGLRQGLPDRLDPVRPARPAASAGGQAPGRPPLAGGRRGAAVWARRLGLRGAQRVLPLMDKPEAYKLPNQQNAVRSEEHTSELQSRVDLVCRLLLEKKKKKK